MRGRAARRLAGAFVLALLFLPAAALAADEAETEGGHGAGAPSINFFEPEFGGTKPPAAFMLLNFAIFAGLLIWKGGPPLRRYLHQRHTEIKEALEEASRLREEAREKLEDYTQRLEKADTEVQNLVAEIRSDAEAEKKRILEEAERQAAAIKRDAESRVEAETQRARAALEREVVAAAIARAQDLLREKATPSDQAGLVDGFIRDLGAAGGSGGPSGGGSSGSSIDEEWS